MENYKRPVSESWAAADAIREIARIAGITEAEVDPRRQVTKLEPDIFTTSAEAKAPEEGLVAEISDFLEAAGAPAREEERLIYQAVMTAAGAHDYSQELEDQSVNAAAETLTPSYIVSDARLMLLADVPDVFENAMKQVETVSPNITVLDRIGLYCGLAKLGSREALGKAKGLLMNLPDREEALKALIQLIDAGVSDDYIETARSIDTSARDTALDLQVVLAKRGDNVAAEEALRIATGGLPVNNKPDLDRLIKVAKAGYQPAINSAIEGIMYLGEGPSAQLYELVKLFPVSDEARRLGKNILDSNRCGEWEQTYGAIELAKEGTPLDKQRAWSEISKMTTPTHKRSMAVVLLRDLLEAGQRK